MSDQFAADIASLLPSIVDARHYLHANPERSDCEVQTSEWVLKQLQPLGLKLRSGVGGYGIVADLIIDPSAKMVALRADMDALPILEKNQCSYRSTNNGVMHACGHDGHTAVLLGVAKLLSGRKTSLTGNFRFIFQPAEETTNGAKRMCDEGAIEGVSAIVALHGWPFIELGQVGVRAGTMMASADTFDIKIKGVQAHAAYPHLSVDPILVGSHVVTALQEIVSREVNPADSSVVSVTQFHAGTAYNIIPQEANISGTLRALTPERRRALPERVREIAEGICGAFRANCEFTLSLGTPPTVNSPEITNLVREVAVGALGSDNIVDVPYSSMGAEDFAFYLEHIPGTMFRLGLGNCSPLHTPTFDFDDQALPIGIEIMAKSAIAILNDNS